MQPRIALTVGDPAGIGPEIAAQGGRGSRVLAACEPIVYAPPATDVVSRPALLSAQAGRAATTPIVRAVEDAVAGRVDAHRHGARQQGGVRACGPAVERAHGPARAPDRRARSSR